jgi:CDP-diacylglycerol--serine O-phosphatidyltransferase
MNEPARRRFARPIILLPNGFTLLNLFFGVFAIVSARRGNYEPAGTYILFGGVADAIDGRVARAPRSGRPVPSSTRWSTPFRSGLLAFDVLRGVQPVQLGLDLCSSTMCAVIRLARFNVEQAGRAKTHFNGLPSPMAGLTLATYYWFRDVPLYQSTLLVDLPWPVMLRFIMVGLSFLMISQVRYAAVPTIGYRSIREVLGSLLVIGTLAGLIFLPRTFFFPAAMGYVIWGVVRTVFVGFLDRRPLEGRPGWRRGRAGQRPPSPSPAASPRRPSWPARC